MNYENMSIENMLETAIFTWLPLSEGAALCCVNVPEKTRDYFEMRGINVTYIGIDELVKVSDCINEKDKFDCVIAFEVIENSSVPKDSVRALLNMITDKGVVYLGTDNRLGLRYFCGDTEPGTGKPFAAVEDYNSIDKNVSLRTRLYARNEIEAILDDAGCVNRKFYSVLPNLKAAQLIYADGYMPRERLATRYMPMYRNPEGIFAREEWMYDSIIRNGMFHQMSNAYLIEIRPDHKLSDVLHVTLSADRGELNSCATLVYDDKVEKRAICPEGENRLIKIKENDDDIRRHGVHVVDSEIIDGVYVMPRIEAPILERVLQQLLASDQEAYLKMFDRYRDVVYSSSDMIENSAKGPILRRCYIDMVPLNCFYLNDDFLFYDQEFYLENEAANLILWRALVIVYDSNPTLNGIISINEMMDRYGITPYAEEYSRKSGEFIWNLRNQEGLAEFNRKNLRDINKVMDNRRKVERALIDWDARRDKLKETCFDDLAGRDIYVFGSGRFADEFICMYRYDYKIAGVLDNNTGKHGADFYGYQISSPEMLSGLDPDSYKVIVCIKNCNDILMQLDDMGVKTDHIGVFDIHYFYPGRQKYLPGNDGMASYQEFYKAQSAVETGASGKHYHVGYIAGVFDLFHLGHLNMFRRAKEMCDYLIVGVVSDDGVTVKKGAELFIPFEERIEMVRSCKYVDEAVEIPYVYCRTPEAFRKYHFDVQFSGSDYINDPGWLAMKAYLEEHGSALEFLSYTQQTSSTKIKALINGKLEGDESQEENLVDEVELAQDKVPIIYNKSYCMLVFDNLDPNNYQWLKHIADQSNEFILGIPDEWVFARIFSDTREYDLAGTKAALESWGWFDEVRVVSFEKLSYAKMYDEVKFDTCFYGAEYGRNFDSDMAYLKANGVNIVSLVPERRISIVSGGSLRMALENITRNQKIVLFGTGVYFDIYMKEYASVKERYRPAYAIDNDASKWETEKDGIRIVSPDQLAKENIDDILVIICSRNYRDMLNQLKGIKDFEYRTLLFNNEISRMEEFGVSATMEHTYLENSHRILIELMREFDKVCRDNHLHYYVICGSLIGVVRHKGMIPWDDDIDIAMPREDYKKLKKIAKKIWNKDNDTFQFLNYMDIGGGAFLDCMPRLFYMKEQLPTKCFDKVNGKATADIEDRMFLDIYVMDHAHTNERVHSFCTNIAMKGIYNLMMGHRAKVDYDEYRGVIDEKTIATMQKVHKFGSHLPIRFLAFWYDAFARSGNWNKKAPDVIMESCAIRCVELKYSRAHFGEGQRVPFESIEVMIPSDYNAQLLDMRYRNYMEFPRMAVRKPSHYFNSDIEIW